MAWLRTDLAHDSGEAEVDEKGVRHYEQIWRVHFDSINHDGTQAIQRIPVVRGQSYVSPAGIVDEGAIAEQAKAKRESDDSFAWLVTVPYSSAVWDQIARGLASGGKGKTGNKPPSPQQKDSKENSPLNPMNRPWIVHFGHGVIRGIAEFDIDGKPITNSAGDAPDPPKERDYYYRTLTIERNLPVPNFDQQMLWESYFDTTNSDVFLGRKPGKVKCNFIDFSIETENEFVFAKVTYEFDLRFKFKFRKFDANDAIIVGDPDDWELSFLDQGTHAFVTILGITGRVHLTDRQGTPVTGPIPLDGVGGPLSVADVMARKFKSMNYTIHESMPFNDLFKI